MKKEHEYFVDLICDGCGWIHFGISLKYAQNQADQFNIYFHSLSKEQQLQMYGGKPSGLKNYCFCFCCGSLFTRMRKLKKTEKLPYGSTIQPILDPKRAKYDIKK